MDIITEFNKNVFNFDEQAEKCFVGFFTGPVRIITAIAQIALNILALLFVSPFVACRGSENSNWSATKNLEHSWEGVKQIGKGILDILPFTSCCRQCRLI